MRGDSLRDFYAKTMAVLGLGLLACAGAVVDYWPVNQDLPTTPAVTGLVSQVPVLKRDLNITVPAPVFAVPAVRPRPADFITATSEDVLLVGSSTSMTLEAAPLPESLVMAEAPPAIITGDEFATLDTAPLPDSITEESRTLLGDALRRTKQRIAAARLLFNDAMSNAVSGVAGAFRKVSPFFATSPIVPGL